ncbi:MAG: DUF1456 family protein [Bdellovibrionaceae bacterium]|nr:DUF1456 family protein [Pseudobdellovibrionaceae bacterium]
MSNNDVLRSVRYMLNVGEQELVNIMLLGGMEVPLDAVQDFLSNEEDSLFLACPDDVMAYFLDGLVIHRRGRENKHPALPIELPMTNNVVLKKLRVAFILREDDILHMLEDENFRVGRAELSALFRRPDHQNYRECGDQLLRNFLKALTKRARG